MASSKVMIAYLASILEAMGLVELGILSGEYLSLSLWCSSLAAKLAVSGDLVADMDTYVKREMRPNTVGMPFIFLYFSWILLLLINPKKGEVLIL